MSDTLWGKPVVLTAELITLAESMSGVKFGSLEDGAVSWRRARNPKADIVKEKCRECNMVYSVYEVRQDGTGETYTNATGLCTFCEIRKAQGTL